MIRLTQHASFDQPRRIPIQLLGTVWLNAHMLLGLALLAGSVVYIASIVKSGSLPTDLALMLDHAKAPATIDAVQTRTKTKGKNMKGIEYLHQFHFQVPGGMQHSGTSISSSKNQGKPAAFVKCTCVLEIAPSSDLPTQVRLTKKLDLAGDASDLLPRPILYRKDRANDSLLLSELGLTGSPDTTSGDFMLTGTPHRPVLIALSVIIIATIVGVMLAG